MTEIKILVICDIHYEMENRLQFFFLENKEYDVCMCLGDIQVETLKYIKKLNGQKPIYGIQGNHDSKNNLSLAGIEDIHCRMIRINDISFVGFEGTYNYKYVKQTSPMYSQKESVEIAGIIPAADVLISHDSAYQLHGRTPSDDAHRGLKGITKYIKINKCQMNIHGHYHQDQKLIMKYGLFNKNKCWCYTAYEMGIYTVRSDTKGNKRKITVVKE